MEVSTRSATNLQNSIHTREKIGTLGKRFLKHVYDQRTQILKISKLVQAMLNYTSDTKKIFDFIFLFEGIGILTRISKNSIIFTGFKGMATKLNDWILRISQKKNNTIPEYVFFADEITIDERKHTVRSSLYLGFLVNDIVCSLLLDPGKSMSRNEIDLKIEFYSSHCKEILVKGLTQTDLINVLVSINLVAKNEVMESISWTGPDCINMSGITRDHIHLLTNLEKILKSAQQDFAVKEQNYFNSILKEIEDRKDKKDLKIKQDIISLEKNEKNEIEIKKPNNETINNFEEQRIKNLQSLQSLVPIQTTKFTDKSFALLKFKTWKYQMKKLQVIIGKNITKENQKNKAVKWLIDVDLQQAKKISRQHAIILYNFHDKNKRFPIKVNGNYLFKNDKPLPLTSKTLITIGTESFYFLQALPQKPEEEEKKEEIEEVAAVNIDNGVNVETKMEVE